jgi:hypothetical protein
MRRSIIVSGVLLAIFAAPAAASSGNGLYEPYPAVIGVSSAKSYYAQLDDPLTAAQLGAGVFRRGLAPSAPGGPSARAGVRAVGGAGVWELLVGVAVGLLAAGLASRRVAYPAWVSRSAS